MTTPIVIFGTGGTCIDVLDTILCMNDDGTPVECVGFLDDDPARVGRTYYDVPVLGPISMAASLPADYRFVNGVGSPFTYRRKAEIIAQAGVAHDRFATLVHPTSSISRWANIGPGSVILQNFTVPADVTIGRHVMVLGGGTLSHHNIIGDYSCIAGGVAVAGTAVVETHCYLGINSTILGGVRIGAGSLVGAGSVVLRDVPPDSVVAGNPAKFVRPAS